jgi:hypothetical protein
MRIQKYQKMTKKVKNQDQPTRQAKHQGILHQRATSEFIAVNHPVNEIANHFIANTTNHSIERVTSGSIQKDSSGMALDHSRPGSNNQSIVLRMQGPVVSSKTSTTNKRPEGVAEVPNAQQRIVIRPPTNLNQQKRTKNSSSLVQSAKNHSPILAGKGTLVSSNPMVNNFIADPSSREY